MKKILLSMLVVALCASCATKKIEKYGYARVELEVPCSKEGFDDAEYFRGTGTASAINQQNARRAALENAKSMVHEKLGGFVCVEQYKHRMWKVYSKANLKHSSKNI